MLPRLALLLTTVAGLLAGSPAAAAIDADAVAPPPDPQFCYAATPSAPAWTAVCIRQSTYFADVCGAIQRYALREELPAAYFARLIWQESHFGALALSVAGAQGIAQFIPSTARLRDLRNAFDPAEALAKSAAYLDFLRDKFGSLGLAAVAYNGGEGRASQFAAGGGYLPSETRYYVEIITGRTAEAWLSDPTDDGNYALSKTKLFPEACLALAKGEMVPKLNRPPSEWQPWGVMLAQQFNQSTAISHFDRVQAAFPKVLGGEKLMLLMARNPNFGPRLRYYAMIGRQTRKDADALCGKLQAAGGACVVRRN